MQKRHVRDKSAPASHLSWSDWGACSLVFIGATSIGVGLYLIIWFALRPLYYRSTAYAVTGAELLVFPLFFGLGGFFWVYGTIKLRNAVHRVAVVREAVAFLQRRSKDQSRKPRRLKHAKGSRT